MSPILKIYALLVLMLLSSCGSKSGSIPDQTNEATRRTFREAKIIDSPIKGIHFITSQGRAGISSSGGVFNCYDGEIISFYLTKNVLLGKAACSSIIFLNHLNSKTNVIVDVSLLLLSLSSSSDVDEEIDLSDLNFQSNLTLTGRGQPLNIFEYLQDARGVDEFNYILRSLGGKLISDTAELETQRAFARGHLKDSIIKFSDLDLNNPLIERKLDGLISRTEGISLDGGVVHQVIGREESLCPRNDLGGINLRFTKEQSTLSEKSQDYFVSLYKQEKLITKIQILTKEISIPINLQGTESYMSGTLALTPDVTSNAASGLISIEATSLSDLKQKTSCVYKIEF